MEDKENLNVTSNGQYEPKLNYSNIVNETKKCKINNDDLLVQGNNYTATFGNGGDFIYFKRKEGKSSDDIEGLKFHISVDPQKMNDAWTIVMDVMAKYGVREAKIANPLIDKPQEPGKEITIYAFKEDPPRPILKSEYNEHASWEVIISELTIRLHNAGIQPGTAATSNSMGGGIEHAIRDTNYVTWRDDFNMMANVKTKISPDQIPSGLDVNDLDEYFETVDINLSSKDDDDMRYKQQLFKYYYDNINNFNQLSHNLNLNLNEQQIIQQDRLLSEEHIHRRENRYIDNRNTPIFPERQKQTFGSGAQILQQLTTQNTNKMTNQPQENEVKNDTFNMTERKRKGMGVNLDFLNQTQNKGQENLSTQSNLSTTNVHVQQNLRLNQGTTKKKDESFKPSTQPNVNTTQTVQDNDFRRRLENIIAKQSSGNPGNTKQDDLRQTGNTQNDTSTKTTRFNPFKN